MKIIKNYHPNNLIYFFKTISSLNNICDYNNKNREYLINLIDKNIIYNYLNIFIRLLNNKMYTNLLKKNIKTIIIRLLTNISSWLNLNNNDCNQIYLSKICDILRNELKNEENNFKILLNICYSCNILLNNKEIPNINNNITKNSLKYFFLKLFNILDNCESYKVKIAIVNCLLIPKTINHYGPLYYYLWDLLQFCLLNVNYLSENGFSKKKYKKTLKKELIKLLKHLIELSIYKKSDNKKIKKYLNKSIIIIQNNSNNNYINNIKDYNNNHKLANIILCDEIFIE